MHTGDPALGHFAASVVSDAVVECRLAVDAEGLGFLAEDVDEFGVAQQGLRRDAADVETDSAPVFGFDDGRVQSQLCGADSRYVSAGSGSEDDNVIVGHGHYPNGSAPIVSWPAIFRRSGHNRWRRAGCGPARG